MDVVQPVFANQPRPAVAAADTDSSSMPPQTG
jgi:hypothetical protein